jgi:photosystem II stability/assembly factor-like uncharacterized protein
MGAVAPMWARPRLNRRLRVSATVFVWTLCLATFVVAAQVGRADINIWTPIGPDGGTVNALAVDPTDASTVYAVVDGRTLKTTDAGQHWQSIAIRGDFALAIDPLTPATIYTGAQDSCGYGLVYKSTDGGTTWSGPVRVGTDLVIGLALDPQRPGRVYAAVQDGTVATSDDGGSTWTEVLVSVYLTNGITVDAYGAVYVAGFEGIHRSTDHGRTWAATAFDDRASFWSLVAEPSGGNLYAGGSAGVFRSTNGGISWEPINAGLPMLQVWSLAVDPNDPATLYAGTERGLFRSSDGGLQWRQMPLPNHSVWDVAAAGPRQTKIYAALGGAGIARSDDGGATWVRANTGLGYAPALVAIHPARPAMLYAASIGGVFRSADDGRTWELLAEGLADTSVTALVLHPHEHETLYAGTCAGIFQSLDGGSTWRPTGYTYEPSPDRRCVSSIVIDHDNPVTMYANGRGVLRTTDGGATWVHANVGLTNLEVHSLVRDPVSPATFYAVSSYVYSDDGCGLHKTTDGAASWQPICEPGVQYAALAIDPQAPPTLYAAVTHWNPWDPHPPDGVYKSTDGGLSWTPTELVDDYMYVDALGIDPTQGRVYAATHRGVYTSVNGGERWLALTAGLGTRFGIRPQNFAVRHGRVTTVFAGSLTGAYELQLIGHCQGDCRRDGTVTVDEVMLGIRIALGEMGIETCVALDFDESGSVEVNELVTALSNVLAGCGATTGPIFAEAGEFGLSESPGSIQLADLNDNHRLDVVATGSRDLLLRLGKGDGTFEPERRVPIGEWLRQALLADVNRDGIPDVIVQVVSESGFQGDILVLLGRGDGSFASSQRLHLGSFFGFSVAVADLNGDGAADVAAMDDSGTVYVLLAAGDGSFAAPRLFSAGGCREYDCPYLVGVRDIDGDGKADVLTSAGLLPGAGDGSLGPLQAGGFSYHSAVVDFNGDGLLDGVSPSYTDTIAVHLGTAAGSFGPGMPFAAAASTQRVHALAVGDLNGDGAPDIVTASLYPGEVATLLNLGTGAFAAPVSMPVNGEPRVVAVGDLNDDGILDIVAGGDCHSYYAPPCHLTEPGVLTVWLGSDGTG